MGEVTIVDFLRYHYNPRNDLHYSDYLTRSIDENSEFIEAVKYGVKVISKHFTRFGIPIFLASTYFLDSDAPNYLANSFKNGMIVGTLDAMVSGARILSTRN